MIKEKQVYWFYKRDKSILINIDSRFKYFFFKPNFFKLKIHKGSFFLYLFWYFFSLGRYRIFYILEKESNKIAHFSHILPKIFKYSFMNVDDLFISSCYTSPNFRGCKLYPFALFFIGESFKNRIFWVGVREDNIASIRGLDRAGYQKVSKGFKSDFFGIYKLYE